MKENVSRLFILLIFIILSLTHCDERKNTEKLKFPANRSIAVDNASPVHLVTIIPTGEKASFMMGTTDEELTNQPSMDHADYYTTDEQPAHNVTLTIPFEISKYEITNDQFCHVMNWAIDKGYAKISNGDLKSPDETIYSGITHLDADVPYLEIQFGIEIDGDSIKVKQGCDLEPVHGVTWFGAIAFCNFLSEIQGLSPVYDLSAAGWDTTKNGFRLPTEAEWEYAARKNKRYTYAWGNEIDTSYLNYGPGHNGQTAGSVFKPVGFYNGELKEGLQTKDNSSPFGIYDMTGNVWEWCWDCYGREYYKESSSKNPKGPDNGDDRPPYDINRPTKVWRGCGWAGNDAFSRITKRWSSRPDLTINEVGFRIARSLF